MMDKEQILAKLAKMPAHALDQRLQEKNLEMRAILSDYALAIDEESVYKFDLRKKLLAEGNSFSKVENMLRSDETLHNLKRKIMGISTNKKKLGIEIEIIKSYYFANKQTGM